MMDPTTSPTKDNPTQTASQPSEPQPISILGKREQRLKILAALKKVPANTIAASVTLTLLIFGLASVLTLGQMNQDFRRQAAEPPTLPKQCPLPGDANCDGQVNLVDFQIWLDVSDNALLNDLRGDFNRDGTVNHSDFQIWHDAYLKE